MKLNPNLKLRRIGSIYMVVDSKTQEVNMDNVYQLNETAATVWRAAEGKEIEPKALAEALCSDYEIEPVEALSDIHELLALWREYGLIID